MNRTAFYSPQDFLSEVIEPALCLLNDEIGYSKAASQLLLGTAIHESMGLRYRKQIGGPALGLFQMEPATHGDIWNNFLAYRNTLAETVRSLRKKSGESADELENNDLYAAAMARVHYYRIGQIVAKSEIPDFDNLNSQSLYWKRHHNTPLGAGTPSKYRADWQSYHATGLKYSDQCEAKNATS
ncbi:hypothetical protein ACFOZ5_16475 [Marinobacter lacisalsi]|uniref:Transglycosylase SLT domain-containing protein n=1 Tax=Marinobacter lacisalsi TaxID=475979 RepID=A0ABV8QLF9_9GAMM